MAQRLLVDSNLLLLYFIGLVNPQRIERFKRTDKYTREDFRLLRRYIESFTTITATPHILAEVSNLATLTGNELDIFRQVLIRAVNIQFLQEEHIPATQVVQHPLFLRLGITDAGIASLRACMVLTDDLNLSVGLRRLGIETSISITFDFNIGLVHNQRLRVRASESVGALKYIKCP